MFDVVPVVAKAGFHKIMWFARTKRQHYKPKQNTSHTTNKNECCGGILDFQPAHAKNKLLNGIGTYGCKFVPDWRHSCNEVFHIYSPRVLVTNCSLLVLPKYYHIFTIVLTKFKGPTELSHDTVCRPIKKHQHRFTSNCVSHILCIPAVQKLLRLIYGGLGHSQRKLAQPLGVIVLSEGGC